MFSLGHVHVPPIFCTFILFYIFLFCSKKYEYVYIDCRSRSPKST